MKIAENAQVEKIAVGMSGGVDSTSAAKMLIEAGYDVTGVYMRLWGGKKNGSSCSTADGDAAKAAAESLGIPLVEIDYTAEFQQKVIVPFIASARKGGTLNPCISCNRVFKVENFLAWALRNGFDKIATGHHARVVSGPYLARSKDEKKDQSYVLYMLTRKQLSHLLLPLGEMTKDDVRAFAKENSLLSAETPDSMDLCFNPAEVLGELSVGEIVDQDGKVLGSAPATELLTIGQRRGLDIGGGGGRKYVTALDFSGETPVVTVGNSQDLLVKDTFLKDVTLTHNFPTQEVFVQTSAHGITRSAYLGNAVVEDKNTSILSWMKATSRIAPGQSAVFYDRDGKVLGGATVA